MTYVRLDADSFWAIIIWIAFVGFVVVMIVTTSIERSENRIIKAIEQLKKDTP